MPTRSSPGSFGAPHNRKIYKNLTELISETNSPVTFTWTDSVTFGNNIPGWRKLLRDGLSATTDMNGNLIAIRFTPGGLTVTASNGGKVVLSGHMRTTGSGIPSGAPSAVSETKANAEAAGRFLRRLREKQTAFEGGVFLGELAQTLTMLRNPAKGLRGLVDEFKTAATVVRQRLRGTRLGSLAISARKANEHLADLWLEAQFGWKPLLHDIDGACQAFAQISTGQSLHTARITGKYEDFRSPTSTTLFHSENIADYQVITDDVNICLVVYRGALRVEALNPAQMEARLLGFDPASFLPTVYELVPYSFLIDYFSNIGDIILGWSQLGVKLAWCNRTVKKTRRRTAYSKASLAYSQEQSPSQGIISVAHSPAKVVIDKSEVSRVEYTGHIIPNFTLRVPGSGSLRWLNIAALVAGRNNDRKWFYD